MSKLLAFGVMMIAAASAQASLFTVQGIGQHFDYDIGHHVNRGETVAVPYGTRYVDIKQSGQLRKFFQVTVTVYVNGVPDPNYIRIYSQSPITGNWELTNMFYDPNVKGSIFVSSTGNMSSFLLQTATGNVAGVTPTAMPTKVK